MSSAKDALKYGLDINGGVYVVMEAQTDLESEELRSLMDQTRAVIDNRGEPDGCRRVIGHNRGKQQDKSGDPGCEDAQEAIDAIGRTAQLRFVLADGSLVVDGAMCAMHR